LTEIFVLFKGVYKSESEMKRSHIKAGMDSSEPNRIAHGILNVYMLDSYENKQQCTGICSPWCLFVHFSYS
jgi:hypothetical protein